jgi:hypothetical protein
MFVQPKGASYSGHLAGDTVASQRLLFTAPPVAIAAPLLIRHMSAMERAYLSIAASDVAALTDDDLFGRLARALPFAVEATQKAAWLYQIVHLRSLAADLPDAHFYMEFLIPRMGRRADLVVIHAGIIFVVEYKLGVSQFERSSLNQVFGYGLDLKHFHETSHNRQVVPVLVATEAVCGEDPVALWDDDQIAQPLRVAPAELASAIGQVSLASPAVVLDAATWAAGRYRPTPTIVEAAQALYRGHDVAEISRSEAGAENLTLTAEYVAEAIERAKRERRKIICFITGVPGSGKTLAGLNLATARQRMHSDEHAVFLSGNGPLVTVLREALAFDACARAKSTGTLTTKTLEDRRASSFVQNIHHFRDEALTSAAAPVEKVAVFDEAQRARDREQTSKFMQQKKGQAGFAQSEPDFLLSVMDRHEDWCAIVCLVGGGQEINTGEAGIQEWLTALQRRYSHWDVHLPSDLEHTSNFKHTFTAPALHLATSLRSFRAERLSDFVGHVIAGDASAASAVKAQLEHFPLLLTRDLTTARTWLRGQRRGTERAGLLASSNAMRLKPHGIFVKAKIDPAKWFLAPPDDIRSSDALEDAGTEFDVQGLELDWSCVCWDGNMRRTAAGWSVHQFKGTTWQSVGDEARQRYIANAYRVLLTRARQGMIVFVPRGDANDVTRRAEYYDEVFNFLSTCGFNQLI